MAFLTSHIPPIPPIFFSCASVHSPRYSSCPTTPNPFLSNTPIFNPVRKAPFPTLLLLSKRRSLLVSAAHFSPRLRRRNSLRKKISESPQVRPTPNPSPDVVEDSISKSVSNDVSFMGFDPSRVEESRSESKSKPAGGTVLFDKLDNWVSQYKEEVEFWGLGSAPIFTVFQDSDGRVENVTVDLDEISRRSGQRFADPTTLNSKISHARFLAREMESGRYALPKNSSIAKFVVSSEKSSFFSGIKSLNPSLQHAYVFPKLSRIVIVLLCGSLVFLATKKSLMGREDGKKQLTQLEREMLRRKMKARMERESLEKGSVEVIQESTTLVSGGRPQIDKDVLMSRISKTRALEEKVELNDSFQYQTTESLNLESKVQEIREMARHAKEIEAANKSTADKHGEENQYKKKEMLNEIGYLDVESNFPDGQSKEKRNANGLSKPEFLQDPKSDVFGFMGKGSMRASTYSNNEFIDARKTSIEDIKESDAPLCSSEESIKTNQGFLTLNDGLPLPEKTTRKKTRVIWSVKEARDYLSEKQKKLETLEPEQELQKSTNMELLRDDRSDSDTKMDMDRDFSRGSDFATTITSEYSDLGGRQSISSKIDDLEDSKKEASASFGQVSTSEVNGNDSKTKSSVNKGNGMVSDLKEFESIVEKIDTFEDSKKETSATVVEPSHCEVSNNDSKMKPSVNKGTKMESNFEKLNPIIEKIDNLKDGKKETSATAVQPSVSEVSSGESKMKSFMNKENWMEENFEEFKPIIEKIGVGFRDNYSVARKKVNQELYVNSDITKLISEDDGELEWMKDDGLRNIVFQVKENELAGRDPFHSLSAEDKLAFFEGLEKKVEKGNEKLLKVHEWIHSNIENIDYGADGISLYDPPEKIFPCWKGRQVDQDPEFLSNFLEQRAALSAKKDKQESLNKSEESQLNDNNTATSSVSDPKQRFNDTASKNSNIVIESSDGSVRAGKKSGKEYWQHTKKWSREFLESYNAESDPEVKSIMKDMGKGLDRWITEKEIAEAAALMNKLPEKRKEFIKNRIDKVKREIELFGPQAVVSKYREYAEETQEDYLWWLDLPYVLCIELYTNHNGDQRIGFYSLEMATDLELTPKPYHVIGFENPGECKNLCYIIQAHMDMLGNGHAFIIARPPKDVFREAKANGFNVTIIRKGELPLNVDDTLEEVEEKITEIGSKMYHDEIMRDRSVDISSLTKGFLGASRPKPRKGSKRRLKRGNKQKRH